MRELLLSRLTGAILNRINPYPTRVAIDGVDASGKTTLADEIAALLLSSGRQIIRVSIDDFHNPRCKRYGRGRESAEGYYRDTTNYPAVICKVLEPLGPCGNRLYSLKHFDFKTDIELEPKWLKAEEDAILLVDGVFLHCAELVEYWDYSIFVQADFSVTLKRAIQRDPDLFGESESVREMYERRYIPGQKHYLDIVDPSGKADVVWDNNDVDNPEMIMQ